MSTVTETLHVSGIRCERCVGRLAVALEGFDGLESASANLVGDVTLSWDDERTSKDDDSRRALEGRVPRNRRRSGNSRAASLVAASRNENGTVAR